MGLGGTVRYRLAVLCSIEVHIERQLRSIAMFLSIDNQTFIGCYCVWIIHTRGLFNVNIRNSIERFANRRRRGVTHLRPDTEPNAA